MGIPATVRLPNAHPRLYAFSKDHGFVTLPHRLGEGGTGVATYEDFGPRLAAEHDLEPSP